MWLWKSVVKVGGTAIKSTELRDHFAVEICRKGGWNSSVRLVVEPLPLWKSAVKVGGTALGFMVHGGFRCGNLP